MDINIHYVTKIELLRVFPGNGNCRSIRITTQNHRDEEAYHEITVYGETDVLDALPKADDFKFYTGTTADALKAAE